MEPAILQTVHPPAVCLCLPASRTSDVLQRDGQGCSQLSWGPKGTVAQLLIGTDSCGHRLSGPQEFSSQSAPPLLRAGLRLTHDP